MSVTQSTLASYYQPYTHTHSLIPPHLGTSPSGDIKALILLIFKRYVFFLSSICSSTSFDKDILYVPPPCPQTMNLSLVLCHFGDLQSTLPTPVLCYHHSVQCQVLPELPADHCHKVSSHLPSALAGFLCHCHPLPLP